MLPRSRKVMLEELVDEEAGMFPVSRESGGRCLDFSCLGSLKTGLEEENGKRKSEICGDGKSESLEMGSLKNSEEGS